MTIAAGTQLGPYRIVEMIGSGGMGEVYRAEDTRLDRMVAVKVLLGTVAANPDSLRRFEQEARTLAALNHPNILAVHDIGTYAGSPYLVSEFLEGETLRDKLNEGALPVRRSVEYALGIVDGLAAGHSKGVVHRDIKPENIFLTGDGRIKILDFGLAKLAAPGGLANEETLMTSGSGTTPGVVLGTVGYMSPEQVRGEPAEATSDIFSFGAVLYEMLSGKRAFKRDTAAETMTAVLREEPPELTESGWHGPQGLQRITERCLEKDPRRRFQSASDLSFALDGVTGSNASGSGVALSGVSDSQVGVAPIAATTKGALTGWIIGALAVVPLCVGAWWLGEKMARHTAPEFTQLTFQRGYIFNARFTKDGASVIYDGQFDNDPLTIYSVRLGVLQPVKVSLPPAGLFAVSTGDEMAVGTEPEYASNFFVGTLSVVPVSGGTPRPLVKNSSSASYTADGSALAVTRFLHGKCTLEYPIGKKLYESNGYLDGVRVSADGKSVGFAEHGERGDDRGWVEIADSAGKVRRLTGEMESLNGLAWSPDGKEIWYTASMTGDGKTLYGVDMAGKVRTILGMPTGARLQDVGPNGRILVEAEDKNMVVSTVDATGKESPHLELYNGSVLSDIAQDGKAIVFTEVGGSVGPLYEVVYRKTDGSPALVLGSGGGGKISPDGTTVAAVLLKSEPELVLYPIGAGETRRMPLGKAGITRDMQWFPDGKHLLVIGAEPGKNRRSYKMDLGNGELQPIGPDGFEGSAVSQDGKRILGSLGKDVVILDVDTGKLQTVQGIGPRDYLYGWTRDGLGLLTGSRVESGQTSVSRVELATGKRTVLKTIEEKDRAGMLSEFLLLAGDEKSYAVFKVEAKSTLWMAEGVR